MPQAAERVQLKQRQPKAIAKRPQSAESGLSRTATQLESRSGKPVSDQVRSSVLESVTSKSAIRTQPPLQAKLTIGTRNDPLEREADAAADRVMRMAEPHGPDAAPPTQRNATSKGAVAEAPASVHEVLRSPGRPLDDATRAFFEPRFEQDFSHVRVHADSGAADSARSIRARAYTTGHHVVFASGAYAPNSHDGRRLIAHELTHVLQQSGGATASTPDIQRSADDDLTRDWVRDLNKYVATNPAPYRHVIDIIRFSAKYDLDDNVAADFIASQSLAQLEQFASTAEGREMLDVLHRAMTTGSVSDHEKVQAGKIRFAKWKSRPAEVYRIVELRDPEIPPSPLDEIISKGADKIRNLAFNKRYKDAINIVRGAGDLDDDIASRFLTIQSPDRLEMYAANVDGRAMLDVLYRALITGDVTAFQRLQADRILLAKAKTGQLPTTADVTMALTRPAIFPLATGWDSTATIRAGLRSDGKVKVYYDSRTGLRSSKFNEERGALYDRYGESIYSGIILDPDELVIVKLFDQGGATMLVQAIQLIDFFNQQKQDTLGKIKMVSVMAATLGLGGVGAGGVLGWADTIAFVTQAGNLLIQANRNVIAKTALGRDFLKAWDVAVKVSEYYGWGRMGVDGIRLVHATVVNPFKLWREEVRAGLNSAEREGIAKVQQKTQEWLDSVKQAEANSIKQAEAAEAAKAAKTEAPEAAKPTPVGSQSATGYTRGPPRGEEDFLSSTSRTRRQGGRIHGGISRPFYAKTPARRKVQGTSKRSTSKPKTADVSAKSNQIEALTAKIEQAEKHHQILAEQARQAELVAVGVRNRVNAQVKKGVKPSQVDLDLLSAKDALARARDKAKDEVDALKRELASLRPKVGVAAHGAAGLKQEELYLSELSIPGLEPVAPRTMVIDGAIKGRAEVHSVKSLVPSAGLEEAMQLAQKGDTLPLAISISGKIDEALMSRASGHWGQLVYRWNKTMRKTHADHFGYDLPPRPDNIPFVVEVPVVSAKALSEATKAEVAAEVSSRITKRKPLPPNVTYRITYVGQ